MITVKAVLQP
jgi:hypothetical protein